VATTLVALGLVALGLLVGRETVSIQVSPSYARIGPRVFPFAIAGGLVTVGLLLLWQAAAGRWRPVEGHARGVSGLALVALGVLLDLALIVRGGFVLASTVLFACTARAFGSRRLLRDVAIGAAFAGLIFAVFRWGLRLRLPAGTWWGFG
jgi:putative tricarboxylic transport membrane protein